MLIWRVKIALQPSAALFPASLPSLPSPLSHFEPSNQNSSPSLSVVSCQLSANGLLLSPFTRSLTQKQGGGGYWYDQYQTEGGWPRRSIRGAKGAHKSQRYIEEEGGRMKETKKSLPCTKNIRGRLA